MTRSLEVDSFLPQQVRDSIFNVQDEHEVLALLRYIHRSALEQSIKNTLRDALFAYRQEENKGDVDTLTQTFAQYGITLRNANTSSNSTSQLSAVSSDSPKITNSSMGQSRRVPQFTKGSTAEHTEHTEQTPHSPAISVVEESQTEVQEAIKPEPQAATDTVTGNKKAESSVAPNTVATTSVTSGTTYTDPSERIKQIKREVNQKVGNPVNLVASHNAIGKEYMNALLNAMKSSAGGGEVNAAMDRLEKAFVAVQELPSPDSSIEKKAEEHMSVPKKTEERIDSSESEEKEVPQKIQVQTVSTYQPDPTPKNITLKNKETKTTPDVVNDTQASAQKDTSDSVAVEDQSHPDSTSSGSIKKMTEDIVAKDVDTTSSKKSGFGSNTSESKITSVAKEKLLQDLMRNNRAKAVVEKKKQTELQEAAMDPLMVPAVTAGLQQLLSEWNLFKSSGFLGTGPSGSEHPLYKKIQGLSMAAVIAGRFEGSTPAIKQSLTDYMNGWRYEEGIVHEHMETFEHYLRRVVRHIINKNKK